ncbi:hypothetical protein HUJ04_004012 [Dendroctonus ponderosae]|nr:hypothetical protein HUJ04_004012 [Dendroctonus ponderosae]
MDESPDSKKAWALSQKIFPILNDFSTCNQEDTFFKSQFEELCNYMQANGLQDFLQQLIINQVEKRFRDEIVPAFWSYFQKSELHNKDLNQFYNAVKSLYDNYKEMDKITSGLELFRQCTHVTKIPYNEKTINNALKLILKATVLAQSPLNYQAVTLSFYETALRIEDVDSYLGFDSGHCAACDQDSCNCLHLLQETNRCVMSSLTEEGPNDLAEELHKRGAVDENINVEDGDDDWETWTPDPIEAAVSPNPPKDVGSRRNVDIISMLVDIYGSNELFVNEYRNLLADRLLSQYTSDTEKEIRYLELLKLKFGDSNLHFCEVMLKDVVDSKRINQRIKEDSEYSESIVPLSTLIVSQQFWPPFKEEKLELHSKVAEQIKQFTAGFETLKGSRTLCWKNHLGVVNIEIELNDRTFNLSVSPMQATILMHFQDKVQNVENKNLAKVVFCDEDFEAESAMASVQDQKDEEFQNIWTYIVGMLKNLDSLPLDRIHHMLKMFAFQGLTTECSPSELKVFLDRKVRKRLLIFSNNLYTLPK